MSIVDSLEKLGLSETEATIYVFLAQNGSAKAPQIQAALEINKLSTYRALNALVARGFVETFGDKRLQKYAAVPVQKVLGEYDKTVDAMRRARHDLAKWGENIANQEEQLYKKRKIQVYEGIEGLRLWYDEWLKGDVDVIYEFANLNYWSEFADSEQEGVRVTETARRNRVQKQIPIQTIFVTSGDQHAVPDYARTRQDHLRETRIMPAILPFSGAMSIFGARFGFYTDENGFKRGVIIEDHTLVRMMTTIFKNLWERGEPV